MNDGVIDIKAFNTTVKDNHLSREDAAEIESLLESAKDQISPFNGELTADWLLTDIRERVWHTTKRGKGGKINGVWTDTEKMDWNHPMPSGKRLSDPKYSEVLFTLQKISFFLRTGLIHNKPVGIRHWRSATATQVNLARYMILHEHKYHPEKFGLSLLDQGGLDHFAVEYAKGGFGLVLEVPQKLLSHFYQSTFNENCPVELYDSLFNLDGNLCAAIYKWAVTVPTLMRDVKYGAFKGVKVFSHKYLAQIACCNEDVLKTQKMMAFLRQFEVDLHCSCLLVSANTLTRFPSHKTPFLEDVLKSGSTTEALVAATNHIYLAIAAHRHLPDVAPNPAYLSVKNSRALGKPFTTECGRTPMMPMDIGLRYLNGSLAMVQKYGDLMVSFYLAYLRNTRSINDKETDASKDKKSVVFNELLSKKKYSKLRDEFGISKYHSAKLNRDIDGDPIDLYRLLNHVIASCVILISILKPSRDEEIIELERDCLAYKEAEGYYLKFLLGKSNAGEQYEQTLKPIPYIAARAIKLLQRLGNGIDKRLGGDTSNSLLYLPVKGIGNVGKVSKNTINAKLDGFGDYLDIKLDEHGRRWYVRIHEMRKFFLLLFFWQGRFNVLDASIEIAGQTDVNHIYRYMEVNFPRETFTELEADYSIQCLSFVDKYHEFDSVSPGFDKLANMVCDHFNVTSLELVRESEWADYIRELREYDIFKLQPLSIQAEEDRSISNFQVAVIFNEDVGA